MRFLPVLTPAAGLALVLFGCQSPEPGKPAADAPIVAAKGAPPTAKSPFAPDPQMEARIDQLLAQMTLEQKVGQMIQADIGNVTEADIKEFRIGSVLNGGGQTPDNKAESTPQEWVRFAEKLYQASMTTEPRKIPIPLMWGVDAVHGHGNVLGATLYPHNIALGATRNRTDGKFHSLIFDVHHY